MDLSLWDMGNGGSREDEQQREESEPSQRRLTRETKAMSVGFFDQWKRSLYEKQE